MGFVQLFKHVIQGKVGGGGVAVQVEIGGISPFPKDITLRRPYSGEGSRRGCLVGAPEAEEGRAAVDEDTPAPSATG